jgi:ribonuclease P protein component
MSKNIALNMNRDFRRVYSRGQSAVSPILVTYITPNRMSVNRVGITASKKIGNAVKRNRAKRIIRAAFNQIKDGLNNGYDIVFVARGSTVSSSSNKVYNAMNKHLKKIQKS